MAEHMSNGQQVRTSTTKLVPFDYAAAEEMPDWRNGFRWPVEPDLVRRAFEAGASEMLALGQDAYGVDERNLILLATPMILNFSYPLMEVALCVRAQTKSGISFVGEPPEFDYLRGHMGDALPPLRQHAKTQLNIPRLRRLREINAVASWTPYWRLPATLLAPQAMAIQRSHLLEGYAADSRQRVGFHFSPEIMRRARSFARRPGSGLDLDALAGRIAELLGGLVELDRRPAERLHRLIAAQSAVALGHAANDLAGLARLRRLPRHVWSGSGGFYLTRAIALEVLRRGDRVTLFDHGGTAAMVAGEGTFAMLDLAVCSRFIMMTPDMAEMARTGGAYDLLTRLPRCAIVGHTGDPSIRELPLFRRRLPGPRRNVIYAPMLLRGFSKTHLTIFPDVMYLDWQLRLAESLGSLPIDLLCKPHPGGILRGRTHPLAAVAPTSSRRFEEEMAEADLFVFDRCTSTTFWRALCTDRPVVYIDLGLPLTAPAQALVERRCRIVKADFGADNCPRVDTEALEEAVMGAPDQVDSSECQRLFMGSAEG